MNGTAPAVGFRDLYKGFDSQRLFEGINLELPDHAVTAIVGASGCGKSTLLNLINGLLCPDRGEVTVFGKPLDYDHLPAVRRRIGYAVQQIGLMPHLRVRDNVQLLATLEKWDQSRRQARIEKLFTLMDLDLALLERYPHQISGGQAQRVGLCRAMMLEPPLLLLDEAFSAVDPITRVEVHERFEYLQQEEKRAVVLVTHDMAEAIKLADHLVVMGPGRVLQAGSPDEIQHAPASADVSRLMEARS
ncbi:ATP-binding cassette domain-containing protein [Phytohalomonas tamaricis]|uniref:ATP-binding cassette domain-containing protein n=1 Tax=Phytohalomonas tamaricis TaxID=2081032 RepID=UPI000D0ACB1F|nr:ATP-binding cassette domain-containing protein [Phytohalomonas tamaricis]